MSRRMRSVGSVASDTHVPALDGLRGIAILLVAFGHFVTDGGMEPISDLDNFVFDYGGFGWVGVDLFFVLSGFLITGILCDARGDQHYFRNFYARRVLRIFPLYYGFLALWLLALPLVHALPESESASSLWLWTYLTNIVQGLRGSFEASPPYTGHFWSLAVEEQFYLVWPIVVLLCSPRRLVLVCLLCLAVAPLVRWALWLGGNDIGAYVLTPARIDSLAAGALIAVLARRPSGIRWTRGALRIAAVAAATAFAAVIWLPLPEAIAGGMMSTLGSTLLWVLFGALLIRAVAPDGAANTARTCRVPTLRFFGRYSYALYVFHLPVAYFVEKYVFTVNDAPVLFATRMLGQLLFIVVCTALSVVVALASWHLYEKHFLRLKRRFAYRSADLAEPPPVAAGDTGRAGALGVRPRATVQASG